MLTLYPPSSSAIPTSNSSSPSQFPKLCFPQQFSPPPPPPALPPPPERVNLNLIPPSPSSSFLLILLFRHMLLSSLIHFLLFLLSSLLPVCYCRAHLRRGLGTLFIAVFLQQKRPKRVSPPPHSPLHPLKILYIFGHKRKGKTPILGQAPILFDVYH